MTDDNSTLVDIPEDLKDFKSLFLGKETPEADEVEDTEDDALATDEDEDASAPTEDEDEVLEDSEDEGEDESEDEESDDEEEPKPEEKEKIRKPSAQKRIDELTKNWRQEQREKQELLRRLEVLETEARKPKDSTGTEDIRKSLPQGAPTPNAVNEDGEAKYPLGEFDPMFIQDLMSFTVEQKTAELEKKRADEAAARQVAEAQTALKNDWSNKLDKYEEEVPEVREHITELVDNFQNLDPAYGEYIAVTIMQCENGPAIMEYLSQNIGEAQKIVASGPQAATLAIGRLEAKLSMGSARPTEEKRNKKPSGAAPPPKKTARGSIGQTSVRPDTEDLAAFKREFLSGK